MRVVCLLWEVERIESMKIPKVVPSQWLVLIPDTDDSKSTLPPLWHDVKEDEPTGLVLQRHRDVGVWYRIVVRTKEKSEKTCWVVAHGWPRKMEREYLRLLSLQQPTAKASAAQSSA
jgi:hypothetical protein